MQEAFMHRLRPFSSFFWTLSFLLLSFNSAHAGWYQIKNYEGMIRNRLVHVSLQTFGKLNGKADTHVVGTYYYDTHRIPIKLDGNLLPDGNMALCESDLRPGEPQTNEVIKRRCVFSLLASSNNLTGSWKSGSTSFDVQLRQIAELDNNDEERIEGRVEIPMWYHTGKAMFVGVYGKIDVCEKIVMSELKIVSIFDGTVLGNMPLTEPAEEANPNDLLCEAGVLMTEIYSNVEFGDSLH
ncbi:MAG: hypothetical protein ACT6WE_12165, partial [Shinella sp.]|uniref:hypothetical protein n=1 Tax=Shinella sp. TaxID=1870904 RepID=UPI0040355131